MILNYYSYIYICVHICLYNPANNKKDTHQKISADQTSIDIVRSERRMKKDEFKITTQV